MYCKYLNLRNNEELAQITMRKRNSTLNQSTLNCPGLPKSGKPIKLVYFLDIPSSIFHLNKVLGQKRGN